MRSNFGETSDPSIKQKVDSFVEGIAYLNFIQDVVKSETAMAQADPQQVELSQRVNREILRILAATHCICWGKPTYCLVLSIDDTVCLEE